MEILTYKRKKPVLVHTVRVTSENIQDVAKWCKGQVLNNDFGIPYIKIPVDNPPHQRSGLAGIGDWVVMDRRDKFKTYTNRSFNQVYQQAKSTDFQSS